ncbi:hypothetical protein ACFWBB_10545 [Streptomyces sp. NPDC060000]|uniref:hypothetical protein n=1 Tax=Streptomyces sp. NPDC060000 TaxID=3347031 RepID=UPI0036CFA0CF
MALGLKPRRAAEALDLESHRAGDALLVNLKGGLDQQALAFARGLPADPEHHLVVLDLPADATDATWTELARLLGRRTGGYRLVVGRRLPGGMLPVGQWLADRLDRTVLVHDGAVVPAAGGVLYVPVDPVDGGSGWVRLQPRRPAVPVSRRFPQPSWEFSVADQPWSTSERVVADPLPSGVWLRFTEQEVRLTHHRARLEARLACQRDLLTVVLGHPGAGAVPLDDVSRFWESVLPGARSQVRFVPYGPLAVPEDGVPGQALADRLGSPVVLYNGLPVPRAPWEPPEVHALDADGALGWAAFARELQYLPARMTGGRATAPSVLSHRPVVDGIPQIAPGVYRYADDAVLEVVPSGLWIRPPDEPADAELIRSAAVDPRHFQLVFGTVSRAAVRMRELAESLLCRMDPVTRGLARLIPAPQMARATRAPAPAALTLAVPAEPSTSAEPDTGATAFGSEVPAPLVAAASHPGHGTRAPVPEPDAGRVRPADVTATAVPRPQETPSGVRPGGGTTTAQATAHPETPEPATLGGPSAGFVAPRGQVSPAIAFGASIQEVSGSAATETGAAEPGTRVPRERPSPDEGSPAEPYGTAGSAPDAGAAPSEVGAAPPFAGGSPGPASESGRDGGTPDVPDPAPPRPTMPSLRLVSAPAPAGAAPTGGAQVAGDRTDAGRRPPSTPAPVAPRAAQAAPAPRTADADTGPEPAPGRGPRPQPVPSPAACALPPRKGIAREREWLRSSFRQQYNDGAGAVTRVLSQSPGLRGTGQTSTEDAVTDLVAARLYLRGDGALLDRAVRGADVGPHVPLARCVTAGLRRLPSYRGATLLRATLDEAEWAWYAHRRLVTEWAFGWALTDAAPALPGDVDFLIWSMTARRTALLDPDLPDRVLFLPGTSFKVLAARDGARRRVLLRELSPSEVGADGRVDTERTPLDEIALSGLDQAERVWRAVEPESARKIPDASAGRFGCPPGLMVGSGHAAPDTPGTTPGKRTTP